MTTEKTTPSEPTGTKPTSVELAEAFLAHCKKYPDQRFWQALLNWSELPFILISNRPVYAAKDKDTQLVDPYHWDGKNGDTSERL